MGSVVICLQVNSRDGKDFEFISQSRIPAEVAGLERVEKKNCWCNI